MGFPTAEEAIAEAKRLGKFADTVAEGQEQKAVKFPDGSWGFWTLHYIRSSKMPSEVLLPNGEARDGEGYRDFTFGIQGFEQIKRK